MDFNTSLVIQLFAYTILITCCLKYLSFISSRAVKAEDKVCNNKRQAEELKQLRRQLHYYNEKFEMDYDLAKRGELKKKSL